jgi:hypothetical protein
MSNWSAKMIVRRQDSMQKNAAIQNEIIKALTGIGDDFISYIIKTMEPIETSHTQKVQMQGYEIKEYIKNFTDDPIDFEFQGSVTNNTHVKAHSDIDLLVLLSSFRTLEPPLQPIFPYLGNPMKDLKNHRLLCEKACKRFQIRSLLNGRKVNLDLEASKAIALSGSGLHCKVDVVPAHWHLFSRKETLEYKGVFVFDKNKNIKIKNTPFLHNLKIQEKDESSNGKARELMRLLKSIKYDSDQKLKISSYDLVSLIYHMPNNMFCEDKIQLAKNGLSYIRDLEKNFDVACSLEVPDQSRTIFDSSPLAKQNFSAFVSEYNWLLEQVSVQPKRKFTYVISNTDSKSKQRL